MAELGPLQDLWDVWTPSASNPSKSDEYYDNVIRLQLIEIQGHLSYKRVVAALDEMVDIMGLALDWMRATGATPQVVVDTIKSRVKFRYKGNTEYIIRRYADRLGQLDEAGPDS